MKVTEENYYFLKGLIKDFAWYNAIPGFIIIYICLVLWFIWFVKIENFSGVCLYYLHDPIDRSYFDKCLPNCACGTDYCGKCTFFELKELKNETQKG